MRHILHALRILGAVTSGAEEEGRVSSGRRGGTALWSVGRCQYDEPDAPSEPVGCQTVLVSRNAVMRSMPGVSA